MVVRHRLCPQCAGCDPHRQVRLTAPGCREESAVLNLRWRGRSSSLPGARGAGACLLPEVSDLVQPHRLAVICARRRWDAHRTGFVDFR